MKNNHLDINKITDTSGKAANPFGTPEGYFEDLHENIVRGIHTISAVEKTADANLFKVPADYFESLPQSISDKINSGKSVTGFSLRRFAIPIAVACAIIFAAIFIFNKPEVKIKTDEEFTASDIQNSDYLLNMDENLLSDFISNSSEDTLNDGYEQYLIDNNIDLYQIEYAL